MKINAAGQFSSIPTVPRLELRSCSGTNFSKSIRCCLSNRLQGINRPLLLSFYGQTCHRTTTILKKNFLDELFAPLALVYTKKVLLRNLILLLVNKKLECYF